jgi:hypothetical protein
VAVDVFGSFFGSFPPLLTRASHGYLFNVSTRIDESFQPPHTQLVATLTAMYPVSARFSDTGNAVRVKFPRATTAPTFSTCNDVLMPTGAVSMDASCVWESTDKLVIRARRIGPRAALRFVAGSIAMAHDDQLVVTDQVQVIIEDPVTAPLIVPNIVTSSQVSFCSDIVLDASGAFI